jgi:hypothetical protein
MKKLLLFALALPVFAQQTTPLATPQPDCLVFFFMTGASSGVQAALTPVNGTAGVSGVIDNRSAACDGWTLTYTNFGFSAVSLLLQSAPNGSSALPTATGVPGTWAAFAGTILTGSVNPSVSITQSEAKATGYFPFLRVNLTSKTGTGIIIGELHGWKSDSNLVSASTGTPCAGTAADPCEVDGPTASGSPPTTPPVLIAGQDTTNVRTVLVDTTGRVVINGQTANGGPSAGDPVIVAGVDTAGNVRRYQVDVNGVPALVDTLAGADAVSNAAGGNFMNNAGGDRFVQMWPYVFNGTTWDRLRGTTSGASVVIAGNGAVLSGQQSVTGSAVALATNTTKSICVKALVSNTINVFAGPSGITTSTGYLLAPGESFCAPLTNTNLLFVIASTTGASVSWIATN